MKLESLILNDLDITKITRFNRMFTNCNNITIYTPNPDFEVWAQKTNRFPTTGKVVVVSPS